MRILVAAVGRLKHGPERQLADRYGDRAAKAARRLGWRAIDVVEVEESRSRRPADRLRDEAARLWAVVPENAVIVVLDARGEVVSSQALADRLRRWQEQGAVPVVAFVIGGPDGLEENSRRRIDLRLAFGTATWPHQLVRIMLLEQLYRAVTILGGHPYHRA